MRPIALHASHAATPARDERRGAIALLALFLLSFSLGGCDRLFRGDLGAPSYVVAGWQVVSEERIDRTHFRYVLRGTCMNAGGDTAGAAGIAVSRSPDTVVVEDQIRCPAVAERSQAPSLDTITIHHDRTKPFDPLVLSGLVLVWGPETLESETRVDRTRFEYRYFTYLANGLGEDQDLIATVKSTSAATEIVDDTVAARVPSGGRLAADDHFAFRQERDAPYDPDVLQWELRLGVAMSKADVDGDGDVDDADVSAVQACTGKSPTVICDCARSDLDADGDVDTSDVAAATAQLGTTGLTPRPKDLQPPVLTVTEPLSGASVGAPPIPVAGTANEALFRLRVNGAEAVLGSGTPQPFTAQAPLGAGAVTLVLEATDLACNVATSSVALAPTGTDRLAPVLRLSAPSRVGTGQMLRAVAEAEDDVGVSSVAFFVDGGLVGEPTSGPYVAEYVAPGVAGAKLLVRAVARDAAGNTAEATAEVDVVEGDDAPPEVSHLALPPTASPGSSFVARAEAQDDRGVAEVRFSLNGGPAVVDQAPPYEVLLLVPAGSVAGARLAVTATAVDGAGQEGTGAGEVLVSAEGDTEPPSQVAVVAPETALPGATIALRATASDPGGIANVRFLRDGLVVAEDATPPYEVSVPLPAERVPGDIVQWTVRATDFAGNASLSLPAVTRIVAPGAGLVMGEVYDDATSRPLAGALVRADRVGGAVADPAPETLTDAQGRYQLALSEGKTLLAITADGYSAAWRSVDVSGERVVAPLDARLTPQEAALALLRKQGGKVESADGAARGTVPAGALAADGELRLTRLGRQSLPLPLPLGWVPLAAFELKGSTALVAPVGLAFQEPGLATAPVAARFDPETARWLRIDFDDAAPGGRGLTLSTAGVVALMRPDATAPPLAEVGEALTGVAPVELPGDTLATIDPSPRVVIAEASARTEVTLRLQTGATLPSGSAVELAFRESYDLLDDSRIVPPGSRQDLLLYSDAEGPTARLVVTPLPGIGESLLREGVIDLVAEALPQPDASLAGPAGARLESPEGSSLEVLPGALAVQAAAALRSVGAGATGIVEDSRFDVLAGFEVELGADLASSAVLRMPLPGATAEDGAVLLVRHITVSNRSELELVAVGVVSDGEVLFGAGGAGLPLPGIRSAGRYAVVRPAGPTAFVTGQVTRTGAPSAGAVVRADTLPFVSLSAAGEGRYAVAAAVGNAVLAGLDPASGDAATASAGTAAAGEIDSVDLPLLPQGFAVTGITPLQDETDVGVAAAVVVRLSGEVDPATLTEVTAALQANGATLSVDRTPTADRRGVVLRPAVPLAGAMRHIVRLGVGLRDVLGRPLAGNTGDGSFESAFTTLDTTPPPRPASGLISLSIPRDGLSQVKGTLGAAPPGAIVFVNNRARGVVTSVLARPDGSFAIEVQAAEGDDVRVSLIGVSGQITDLAPIPFSDGDGSFLLGALGGSAFTPGGVQASLLPGAFTAIGTLRIEDLASDALPAPLPGGLTALSAFALALDEALFNHVARVTVEEKSGRFPSRDGFPTPARVDATFVAADTVGPASRFTFLARAVDALGVARAITVEATGRGSACGEVREVRDDLAAPRLRLEAPLCLGPSEAFEIHGEAIEPRLDVAVPLPPGTPAGGGFVVLRHETSTDSWTVEEIAEVRATPSGSEIASLSRAPFGIRRAGIYVIAHSATPLAFVEGRVAGPAARVGSDASGLAVTTASANEAFLLPVRAGQAFTLQLIDPATGGLLVSRGQAALVADAVARIGRFAVDGAPALAVAAELPPGAALAGRAPLRLAFSEPMDPATLTPTSLIVSDARGRAVAGERSASGDGTRIEFRPTRPWHFGEAYGYRVTFEAASRSGAALDVEADGTFSGFAPRLLATLQGIDVKDAAVSGPRVHLLDEARLRSLDLTNPAAPVEGTALTLAPVPNALQVDAPGTPAATLLVTAGTLNDFGSLQSFGLAAPLAPLRQATRRISTPAGAPVASGVPEAAGEPAALAIAGAMEATPEAAAVISTRGIGLQRLALAALGDTGTPPTTHPSDGSVASFTDVTAGGGRVVSVGPAGLQVHDATSLATLGRADVDGTALDVDVAEVRGRLLALVAAGLPGGVQVYAIAEDGTPQRIAKVLTGCGTARVSTDAALARGWVACTGARLGVIDLESVDGLDRIDADGDGRDDRLAGLVDVPGALADLDLDRPRALALLSARGAGLAVLQTGPAEVRIEDVRRDVLPGPLDEEPSIYRTGRAFFGDQAMVVDLEARIPPGHPGLRALLDGDAPLEFEGGGRERVLVPGGQRLVLRPQSATGGEATSFVLRIVDVGQTLAAFAGRVEPVPLDSLVSVAAEDLLLDSAEPAPILLYGTDGDDLLFNLTPLASFEVTEPAVGTVGADGRFTPRAGGDTAIVWEVAGHRESLLAHSNLPPAIAAVALDPEDLLLRIGEVVALTPTGELTDGEIRVLGAGDGIVYESSDPAVATINATGTVRAVTPGEATLLARVGEAEGVAHVSVSRFVAPDVSGVALELERQEIFADQGAVGAEAALAGTGSLDRIQVVFRLEGIGAAQEQVAETLPDGTTAVIFENLVESGSAIVTARVVDPADGTTFQDARTLAVRFRNADAEPNGSAASAILLQPDALATGEVGGSDAADFYRFERQLPGALRLEVTGAGATATLLDAAGTALGLAATDGAPLEVAVEASNEPLFVRVGASAGGTSYGVSVRATPIAPVITAIVPASAPQGATVEIRGSGFSPDPERNTVLFGGLQTEVSRATPTLLEVVVPAYANAGAVVAWVGSQASNPVAFSTGAGVPWLDLAMREEILPEDLTVDEETGNTVVRDRIEASFRPSVVRAQVDTLAAQLGAEIVGVWPPLNAYELRFPVSSLAELRQRLPSVRALPGLDYVRLVSLPESNAFPIAGRDDFPGLQVPANPKTKTDARIAGAYAQIRAFEAWQWLADSGHFAKPNDYATIRVGVIDQDLITTDASIPQLSAPQVVNPLDLNFIANTAPSSHGTNVDAVIGARNVEDAKRRSTGILGGVVPPDAPPPAFYTVDHYQSGLASGSNDTREIELALSECPPTPPGGVPEPCPNPLPMDVVNLSLGIYDTPGSGDVAYYRKLVKGRPNTLFVASAGNNHKDAKKHLPSGLTADPIVGDRVISVAAVGNGWRQEPSDRRADVRASFSNYGRGVDIAAPGENVLTVATFPEKAYVCRKGVLPANNSFDFFCGTSAAAPLVTGTAGLLKAISPTLTPQQLKTMLIESATPLKGVANAVTWGQWSKPRRLDVLRAVQLALRHKSNAPGGAASLVPGGERHLWVPDRLTGNLVKIRFDSFAEDSLTPGNLEITAPVSLSPFGCSQPYAAQASLTGQKVYIACRGSNQILVWWAATNKPADFTASPRDESKIPLQVGFTSYKFPNFPSIQMALSDDGQVLAVPLKDRRVAFIDTRTDRIMSVRKFKSSVNIGEVRALAFGSDQALYAVTSESNNPGVLSTGLLVKQARLSTGLIWPINSPFAGTLKKVSLEGTFGGAARDGPREITILPKIGADQIYVTYGGIRAVIAASAHQASDLALINPTGDANGLIRSNIANRFAKSFRAGDIVDMSIGSFTVLEGGLRTSTSEAEGLLIDPARQRGYAIFHGTGNVAFLKPHAGGSFQNLASTTRILGDFLEPRTEQKAALDTQLRADGSIDAQIVSNLAARESRLYFQDDFPISVALDQQGNLLASFLAGRNPRLRLWSTEAIRDADEKLVTDGKNPGTTTLDEVAPNLPPLHADFAVGAQAVPSLAFAPTLSISAPAAGAITRGVVAVHPTTRDSKISKFKCEVRRASNGTLVASDVGKTVGAAERLDGLLSRMGTAQTGSPVPICTFPSLPRNSYILRVIGETIFGDEVVAETPFKHEAW